MEKKKTFISLKVLFLPGAIFFLLSLIISCPFSTPNTCTLVPDEPAKF